MSAPPGFSGDEGKSKPVNLFRLQLRRDLVRSIRMYGRIKRTLQRFNPAGTGFGGDQLQYDYEARVILQRLFGCHSEAEARSAIQEVFAHRFGSKNVFSAVRFSKAAQVIWDFWEKRR